MSSQIQQSGVGFSALIEDALRALCDESTSADERIKRTQAMLYRWVSVEVSSSVISGPLTPRENAVLRLICQGQSNKRMAQSLGITPETIKSHAKHILRKLNAQTRAEAVALAAERDLLAQSHRIVRFGVST